MTNNEWLKSLEPAELKAWFDAEHDADADRLQRENMQLARDLGECMAERDEWKTKCETREVAYKQADAERKRYSEQIDELRAERDGFREKLGGAVDSAWEIVQLMDEGAA